MKMAEKLTKRENWFEWPYKQRKIIKGYTDVALLTGLFFAEKKKVAVVTR